MKTQAASWTRGRAGRYAATALGAMAVLALGVLAPAAAQAAASTTLYVSQGSLYSGTCTSARPCATASYALTRAASGPTIQAHGFAGVAFAIPYCPRVPSVACGPQITSVSPSSGSTSGGTAVTITDSYSGLSVNAVWFGGMPATDVTQVSAGVVTAVAPAHASGVVQLQLGFTDGEKTAPQSKYTYFLPTPGVTGVSPAAGPVAGGTVVTVTGSGFTGASAVMFGAVAATSFTVNSDSQITATAPAQAAGPVDVTVTSPGGVSATSSADAYTYAAVPAVTGVSPAAGPVAGGTVVTVTGSGFTGASAVMFGAVAATSFTVNSDSQITAVSPSHATGVVSITVTTPGGTSTVVTAAKYTYLPAPKITAVSPNSGPGSGGTTVTITGARFTGVTMVTFGKKAAASFTVDSATEITAVSPSHATGIVNITVTTPGGISHDVSADKYTYVAAAGARFNHGFW
jgi:hypothetical protein